MQCVDRIEALSASSGSDPAALTAHRARCPRCAALARGDARLDRLWELTRPEEPSAKAWATVWGQVSQALEAAPEPRLRLSPVASEPRMRDSAPWRRRAWGAFAIAQAAVLLVGAWLVTRPHEGPIAPATRPLALAGQGSSVVPGPPPAVTTAGAEIQIDDGDLVLIRSGIGGLLGVKVVSNARDEVPRSVAMLGVGPVDSSFVALGILEALAE